ncbi:MAG: hypothetical protein ABI765_11255 [Gemmatimonadota bacterium]
MHCQEFLRHYSAWRDGLEPGRAFEMEQHLDRCLECQAHHEALHHGVTVLFQSEVELSPDFADRLEQRLRHAAVEHQAPHVSPLAVTAMAVLGALIVALAVRRPAVAIVAAEAQPPVVAHPVSFAAPPFVVFTPRL